jgi:hypothetical protein
MKSNHRRKFLGALGSGAAALGAPGLLGIGNAFAQDDEVPPRGGRRFFLREDRFGRIFPRLGQ